MADEREPIDDLLGAYALDAVDDHERRQVEAYLETDPRARAEVEGHREVAAMLAFSGERPPEGLWDRIAGAIEDTAPPPGPELARVLPMDQARRRRSLVGTVAAAVAAAAAAVAITLVVVDRNEAEPIDAGAIEEAFGHAWASPDGRHTELVADAEDFSADAVVLSTGTGYLSASDLPELPDTETYQLWGVYGDDDVISLGVLGNRPGIEPFTAEDDVQTLVITREQAGGVMASTTGAVLVGELG
ncbi:MAG: anti-sigma factor [Ilumatobacteraceae bacterium]